MNKNDLIRCRAGLAALMLSSGFVLGGCASSIGFAFETGKDNSYVALENSYINNTCIEKCYVVEAYNKLTEETELFIAKRDYKYADYKEGKQKSRYYYLDSDC